MIKEFMIRSKEALLASGLKPSSRLDMLNRLLEIGRWLRIHRAPNRFASRLDLYRHIQQDIIRDEPLDYLEFGVSRGESLKIWLELNRHPRSRFFGFDTFRGLPEKWTFFWKTLPQGAFGVGGTPPAIADARLTFIQGLFQEVLPGFLKAFRPQGRLVVNCDADLYSSTLFVLAGLDPFLKPGTTLLLDEITTPDEFQAFRDYTRAFGRTCRMIARAGRLYDLRVALEMT